MPSARPETYHKLLEEIKWSFVSSFIKYMMGHPDVTNYQGPYATQGDYPLSVAKKNFGINSKRFLLSIATKLELHTPLTVFFNPGGMGAGEAYLKNDQIYMMVPGESFGQGLDFLYRTSSSQGGSHDGPNCWLTWQDFSYDFDAALERIRRIANG